MHYQAAGIINHYDFDSILLGSSILVNTSSFEASNKLGGKWVNLSVSGGGIQERLTILKYALKNKKIKQVIFTLEPGWLTDSKTNNQYAYLYNDNRLDDFKTYINEAYIFCLFIPKICLKGEESLDRPSRWDNQEWVDALLGGFHQWIKNANRPDIKKILDEIKNFKQTSWEESKQSLDPELLEILKQNSQIKFYFVIPPFSRLGYKIRFVDISGAITSLLKQGLSNVEIYGFDDTNLPNHLEYYVDTAHYSPKINSLILDSIKKGSHMITLDSVGEYFSTMKKQVEEYDIQSLKNQLLE